MRTAAEALWFGVCLTAARLLRAGRYATARIDARGGERRVLKARRFYAPALVAAAAPLMRLLGTGVRVLAQRPWEARERALYRRLHGASIAVRADGTLVLPCLPGATLAALLDDPAVSAAARRRAVAHAVAALAALHRLGLTHADAMAENVLVDLDAGVARWFDFETVHDARRSLAWRRADDLRALLATCLVRVARDARADTLAHIVDAYGDPAVTRELAAAFASPWRRPLAFHLAQARLSRAELRDVARQLRARVTG